MKHQHLLGKVFNTPLLINGSKLDSFIYGMQGKLGIEGAIENLVPEAYLSKSKGSASSYAVDDGIAVIRINGVLAHFSRTEADSSFILGYETISKWLNTALNDDDVKAILFVLTTPGGETTSCPELADEIANARSVKPIYGIGDGLVASAGYWIGSACEKLYITSSGYAGSIGVVLRHFDYSEWLKKEGIKVTHVTYGGKKADGNMFDPLSEETLSDLQEQVNTIGDSFVASVAKNRSMKKKDVKATEAGVFMGSKAVDEGLADGVTTPDKLLAQMKTDFSSGTSSRNNSKTEVSMSDSKGGDVQASATTDERTRIKSILAHDEAAGRKNMAEHLAFDTEMSVDDAAGLLATAPKTIETLASASPLDNAMVKTGSPGVGSDEDTDTKITNIKPLPSASTVYSGRRTH